MNELNAALRMLVNKRDALLFEARKIDDVIKSMQALAGMGVVIVRDEALLAISQEYAGMGILEAARAFVKAAGRPMTTREITDGLLAKGWTTKSRNISATIYATLKNSKAEWRRTYGGDWEYFGAR